MHAPTKLLCTPGSEGHEQLVKLLGLPLDTVPFLHVLSAKCRFAMSSGRQVEGLRAVITVGAKVAPHHGPWGWCTTPVR